MSRSKIKFPIWKTKNFKIEKKMANKKVRKSFCENGGFFKKVYESWRICDWRTPITESKRVSKKDLSK